MMFAERFYSVQTSFCYIMHHIIIKAIVVKLPQFSKTIFCIVMYSVSIICLHTSPQNDSLKALQFELRNDKMEQAVANTQALPFIGYRGAKVQSVSLFSCTP
jgi:hypothetical protein